LQTKRPYGVIASVICDPIYRVETLKAAETIADAYPGCKEFLDVIEILKLISAISNFSFFTYVLPVNER
jgi:hypothetical protein